MKKVLVVVLFLFNSVVLSANCENKLFSFTIKNQNVSILNVLENISDECKLSLVFEDVDARNIVNTNLNYINIKDASLNELFDLFLGSNDLYYEIQNNRVLKLSYKKTKTFYIDYVSFTKRKSTGNQVVKTGTSSNSNNNNNNDTNNDDTSNNSNNGNTGGTTIDFESEFKFWDQIQSEINYILSQGKSSKNSDVLINQDAGMLTVTGTKKQLERVEKYIKMMMKRLHKEILVEAKVIEVQYNDNKTTGIDWSKFDLAISAKSDGYRSRATSSTGAVDSQDYQSITDGFVNTLKNPNYMIGYSFSMDGLIKFLKTQGDVKIVSNPKIMTLNNQAAIINVGEEINYRYDTGSTTNVSNGVTTTTPSYETDSTFVGVTLDITPQVTDDGFIVLKINPVVSEVSKEHIDAVTNIPYLAPNVKIRQLSSIVRVKDGDKVLVGGLISKKDDITDTSVPGLSAIPFFGEAFKSSAKVKTKSEMIIVLIPHIVHGEQAPSLDKLDKEFKEEL